MRFPASAYHRALWHAGRPAGLRRLLCITQKMKSRNHPAFPALCNREAFYEQLAGAFHCVLLLCNMVTTVIEQAGEWFAGGLPAHAVFLHRVSGHD